MCRCYECDGVGLINPRELYANTLDDWEEEAYEEDRLISWDYSMPTSLYDTLFTVTGCPYCEGTGKE